MRVLITGVAGHLGSSFARWLLANTDVEIVGVDNLSCGYLENVPEGVDLHVGDLLDGVDLPPVDYVFHFAAYAAECLSPFIRRFNYTNNLVATANLINWAINAGSVKRFVFTSSMAVYGRGSPPFAEDAACHPIDPYGVAKLACERDLQIAGEQHGLPWCIIRPHNLYGPGQSIWQKYRNVLGLWMRAALEGKPLRVYGDGQQLRAFSFIDDCLPCLWAAATNPEAQGQIINLGGERPISIANAAKLVSAITGQGEIVHLEPRHEAAKAWCTVEKSQRLLGYREQTGLCDGLEAMWAWAQDAWERYPERRELPAVSFEVTKGLPSYWRPGSLSPSTLLPSVTRPGTRLPSE